MAAEPHTIMRVLLMQKKTKHLCPRYILDIINSNAEDGGHMGITI